MILDIKTLIFLSSIAAIVMGISILVTSRAYPQIRGVTKWTWGCGAQSIAWILIYLNGSIPDFFSVAVSYTFLLLSLLFFYEALLKFNDKSFSKGTFYPLIALCFFAFTFLTEVYPSQTLRITVVALAGSILTFLCASLLFKVKSASKISERIMSLGFLLMGLSPVAVIIYTALEYFEYTVLISPDVLKLTIYLSNYVAILILTSSFMLMINDKFMGEIMRLATLDSLTEVYNRAALEKLIDKEIDRSKRYGLPMSLLLLDLDYFKKVNDTYGHQVGDFTLKKVVETITKVLREHDVLGRFGGEEFTILLPDTDLVNAHIVAERMRNIVEKTPIEIGSKSFGLTVSIGFATLNNKTDDFQEIFRRADLGLYKAKQTGRNRVVAVRDRNIRSEAVRDENSSNYDSDSSIDIFKSNPNLDIPSLLRRDMRN